ncbi:MAG: hypothetical protein QOG01_3464, partial [Pseudonocardiales bacterium]|nr:hypothetical protein [Pseudonocardiales bacterium]
PVAGVIMARVWSRGLLVLEFGGMRSDYGSPWPVSPEIAGWEIHLVDACGRVFRCYGGPDSSIDDDLDRLRARIHGAGAQIQTPVVRTQSTPAPVEGALAAQVARLMARAS